jgi:hypothetical protein
MKPPYALSYLVVLALQHANGEFPRFHLHDVVDSGSRATLASSYQATNELLDGFVLGVIGRLFSFFVAIILDSLIRRG